MRRIFCTPRRPVTGLEPVAGGVLVVSGADCDAPPMATDAEPSPPGIVVHIEHRAEGAIVSLRLPREALDELSEHGSLRYDVGDDVEFEIRGLDVRSGGDQMELVRLEVRTY